VNFLPLANPRYSLHTTEIPSFSHLCILLILHFSAKAFENPWAPLVVPWSRQHLEACSNIIHHLYCSTKFCFLQGPEMANQDLKDSKHHWAGFLQAFNISKHCGHLFVPVSLKQPLHLTFLQNQVSARFSFFSKLCHALDSPCFAEFTATWITWIGEPCCEKLDFSFSCTNIVFHRFGLFRMS
jgi:hypothetical protein